MKTNGKKVIFIDTELQLINCICSKVTVEIYVGDELDYIGEILSYTDNALEVNGGRYLIGNCEIWACGNYLKVE
ncbi:hypothetical protein [Paenibacillus ihbetae]|uniref:hypothetical protein n=1 Tax=Paenibacillus ihbetae TaxID=1870820 RepID=UPI0012FFF652|nr:hypothetical protein [Paenibacillus ihbetae]